MARRQMFCIVTPRWPGSGHEVTALSGRLDALLSLLGWVHFASLALLPASPDESSGTLPSLMFELAVDEGIVPEVLVKEVVACGGSVLWELYAAQFPGDLPQGREQRMAWLHDFLWRHLNMAAGAFVGARDRTVSQILLEAQLFRSARAQARQLTAQQRVESDWLARQMRAWAWATRQFDWARTAAPQSFWPAGGLRRVLLALALMCAALAALWYAHGCWRLAGAWLPGYDLRERAGASAGLFVAGLLGLLLLAVVTGPALWTSLRDLGRAVANAVHEWQRRCHIRASFEVPRAQQVHESLLKCETELLGRPNHIISLTDVRAPVRWHGAWLRFWLALIDSLGVIAFVRGRLGRASGIKFGHWHLIDGGRRLLFCSNYDGAFGGYLDEFIRGAAWGVNLIWGRTSLRARAAAGPGGPAVQWPRSFPPRRCLSMYGGCEHELAFKAYARDSMLPHLYVFQAYAASQGAIERGTALRNALFAPSSPANDDVVARALES